MENTTRILLRKCDEFLKDKKYLESWKRKSINCESGKKTIVKLERESVLGHGQDRCGGRDN